MYFKDYMLIKEEVEEEVEGSDKPSVSIEKFLGKIMSCLTPKGLDELESYYTSRIKNVTISDTDDIQIRDAIDGRREAFSAEEDGQEVEDF